MKLCIPLVLLLLSGCFLDPGGDSKPPDKAYSEELVDQFLDKLNPDFVRTTPFYSENHLLIMKTAIKSEFSGNHVEDSEDFNTLIPFLIHSAMVTNAGFEFTQAQHLTGVSEVIRAGLEIKNEYGLTSDQEKVTNRHIIKNSIGYITASGVDPANLHLSLNTIISKFFTVGSYLDDRTLIFIAVEELLKNDLTGLVLNDLTVQIIDSFSTGYGGFYGGVEDRYNSIKVMLLTIVENYNVYNSYYYFQVADKLDLTCKIINRSVGISKGIEGLSLSGRTIEEELIYGAVSYLRSFDPTLTTTDISNALDLESSITLTASEIKTLIES